MLVLVSSTVKKEVERVKDSREATEDLKYKDEISVWLVDTMEDGGYD